jgi:1-deoxy-D-xylulose-5-phosphate reductoisomerase
MILLGSTGSIGVNTLKIAKEFELEVEVLVAGNNYKLLNKQIKEFNPKYVVVKDKETAKKVDFENVEYSQEAILEVIEKAKSDIVVNALVGEAGLKPTLKANECKKKLALANKESLVIAGKFVDTSKLTPIDSEHFGLWYLLNGRSIEKMTITASGGALRDYPIDRLDNVSLDEVLNHPNWSMGQKITIDSATMVNKLFEVLEAKWLFGVDNIDAIIETSSTIHSMIDFVDGSTIAHIAKPNMQLPIAFALLEKVDRQIISNITFADLSKLEFRKIDIRRYPIWQIKDELLKNPDLGVVVNTINEIAIDRFINKRIDFKTISKMIIDAVYKYHNLKINSLNDIFLVQNELKMCYNDYCHL